jgi:hypothetical protein
MPPSCLVTLVVVEQKDVKTRLDEVWWAYGEGAARTERSGTGIGRDSNA